MSKLSRHSKVENTDLSKNNYFCSELVACLYMSLGILDKKVPAKNYLPGSFSSHMSMPFVNQASLGPEYIIEF